MAGRLAGQISAESPLPVTGRRGFRLAPSSGCTLEPTVPDVRLAPVYLVTLVESQKSSHPGEGRHYERYAGGWEGWLRSEQFLLTLIDMGGG